MKEDGPYVPQWQQPQYASIDASTKKGALSCSSLNSSPEAHQQNVQPLVHLTAKTATETRLEFISNIKTNYAAAENFPATTATGAWFKNYQKNIPQLNSAGAACFIFASGGINMAYSVHGYKDLPSSWFIGVIIGALLGMLLANRLRRKSIILCSAFMVILCGIIFTALPSKCYGCVADIAARYINGIANGLVFAPILVLIGEEAIKTNRGMIASTVEAFSFSSGVFLQSFLLDLESTQRQGILQIFCGAIAFIIGYLLFIESPIYFLMHNKEEEAIDSLRRLQHPGRITAETHEQLAQHKRYISENAEMSVEEAALAGLPALVKLCVYRGLAAICFNMITCTSWFSAFYYRFTFYAVGAALCWLSSFIAIFLLDSVGRKRPMLLSIFICSAISIAVLGIFYIEEKIIMYLVFVFQFFVGFLISPSSAYLTEAFPLAVKTYYISFVLIVEMLVHIIILSADFSLQTIPEFCLALGVIGFLFCLMAIAYMPETKRDTLRDAQVKFGHNIRCIYV